MVKKWLKMVTNGRKWSENGQKMVEKWSKIVNFFDNYQILSKNLNIFDIFDNEISLSNWVNSIKRSTIIESNWHNPLSQFLKPIVSTFLKIFQTANNAQFLPTWKTVYPLKNVARLGKNCPIENSLEFVNLTSVKACCSLCRCCCCWCWVANAAAVAYLWCCFYFCWCCHCCICFDVAVTVDVFFYVRPSDFLQSI